LSTGLIALLDDIAAIAKVAAATLDDVVGQAGRAGVKAAGVVIDDAAVTPRYVVGFAADRELPIIRRIAVGSLRNKLLILLPAALALSLLAPWAITPLLMLGGAFLCYEGAEKLYEKLVPHQAAAHAASLPGGIGAPQALEDAKVRGAIQTDFILSAEIMAIALATIPEASFWSQALILAVVAIGITGLVYGAVALIVKADDLGVHLAGRPRWLSQVIGRGLVRGMPPFLILLGTVGTAAMLWVGGGILLHGMEGYGLVALPHAVHDMAAATGTALPVTGAEWVVQAMLSGLFGALVGALLIPVVQFVIRPVSRAFRSG
jgi:predicted DNA repair protein MutK